jgi:2-oxoglutarate dehydrogenase E2 component (dihydrolipoamide succinyltransferase)
VSSDPRIVDGKDAVTFPVRVKEAIEDPARLVLANHRSPRMLR